MRCSRWTVLVASVVSVVAIGGTIAVEPPRSAPEFAVLEKLDAAEKPVTLTFDDVSLKEAFAAVQQATGIAVEVKDQPERRITVRTGRVPLRDALTQIAKENGLRYEVPGPKRLIVWATAAKAS